MKKLITIISFFILSINLNSKEIPKGISKDTWTVYFGDFEGIELSSSNQLLASTIPMFFRNNLDSNFVHFSNKDEFALVLGSEIESEIKNIKEKRLELLKKRDALLFKKSSIEADYDKVDREIEILNFDIDTFMKLNPKDITMKPFFGIDIEPDDKKKN